MRKTLRSPEKMFAASMWIVSLLFAAFLIGLGGKIIADLQLAARAPEQEDFADRSQLAAVRQRMAAVRSDLGPVEHELNAARNELEQASNASVLANNAFNAWVATRQATGQSGQDMEVTRRTNEVVQVRSKETAVRGRVIALQHRHAELTRQLQHDATVEDHLLAVARPAYERATYVHEMWIFAVRLAFTLPLLALAAFFVLRHRASRHWPLMRGFVIAALFAFFFELVPYLPSIGGYVRFIVGVILTGLAGHHGIRWMQRYLQRRQEEEQLNEAQRRASLNNEEALRKMKVASCAGSCPDCERPIMTTGGVDPDFCCHCGLMLFNRCMSCKVRKNAYFSHCMSCGTPAANATATATGA